MTSVIFDPFSNLGFGGHSRLMSYPIPANTVYARTSNALFYVTPDTLGGFFGEVSYAFGNMAPGTATSSDGNSFGAQIGYTGKNFKIAAATMKTAYASGNIWQRNLGGQHDYSAARFSFVVQQISREGSARLMQSSLLLGARVYVPGGALRLSYVRLFVHDNPGADADQFALGYVYDVSKRTQLYATAAYLNNHHDANFAMNSSTLVPQIGGSSTGIQFGISHKF